MDNSNSVIIQAWADQRLSPELDKVAKAIAKFEPKQGPFEAYTREQHLACTVIDKYGDWRVLATFMDDDEGLKPSIFMAKKKWNAIGGMNMVNLFANTLEQLYTAITLFNAMEVDVSVFEFKGPSLDVPAYKPKYIPFTQHTACSTSQLQGRLVAQEKCLEEIRSELSGRMLTKGTRLLITHEGHSLYNTVVTVVDTRDDLVEVAYAGPLSSVRTVLDRNALLKHSTICATPPDGVTWTARTARTPT